MNNSFLAIENLSLSVEEKTDNLPILREREGKIIKILDAIQGISGSKEWSTLKEEVFESLTENLERQISSEARKESPDTLKLNRLAGQLIWAEKYSSLEKLENIFRVELTNIRKQLYGKTKEPG
jgi:hypothetical protein